MPENGQAGPVEVNIRCSCPGRPHADGDTVYLRPHLNMEMGLAAWSAVRQSGRLIGDTDGALLSVFLRYGITSWTCRDEEGPLRITGENIAERLGWGPDAVAVGNRARELYYGPFWEAWTPEPSESAPPTPATPSTSANPVSGPSSPTSSEPSSPSEPVLTTSSPETGA